MGKFLTFVILTVGVPLGGGLLIALFFFIEAAKHCPEELCPTF